MKTKAFLVLIGGLLLMAALGIGMVFTVNAMLRQTVGQAVQPIEDVNQALQTKVSELTHPTPTIVPDPVTIIQQVRSLARLETIHYNIEKVITAEEGQNELKLLFGDKLIFVAHGEVIAGIDLQKMLPEDLWVKDRIVYMTLPDPEVFVVTLDNKKSYVYNRDTGLLTKGDPNLEKAAREAAETEILAAAKEDGILNLAKQNAETYITRLMRGLGFADVVFVPAAFAP